MKQEEVKGEIEKKNNKIFYICSPVTQYFIFISFSVLLPEWIDFWMWERNNDELLLKFDV